MSDRGASFKKVATDSESLGRSNMWGYLNEILTQSVTDVIVEREFEVDQYLAGPLLDLKSSPIKW